jgi:hypothetical protein
MSTSTLTAIAPVAYSVAQELSNEPIGAINAIYTSFDNKGVAKGDKVKVPVAPMASVSPFTPASTFPAGDAKVAGAVEVEITNSDKTSWVLTHEQVQSLRNGGNFEEWVRQLLGQGMRALRNTAETACLTAIKVGASKAVGTANVNPFGSSLHALADVKKILMDQGAPLAELQFVGNSASYTEMLKNKLITDASAAGAATERRTGIIDKQYGFDIRVSGQIAKHLQAAPGTAYATNAAALAKALSVDVKTGVGAIPAGSIVSIADDASLSKYVVSTAIATNADDLIINRPGFAAAIADNKALTFTGDYTPNFAFERSAIVGIMRPPILDETGIISTLPITDPFGVPYLLVELNLYGQTVWELHLAYGFKAVQPEHIAILIG